jgi:hypothetical protein
MAQGHPSEADAAAMLATMSAAAATPAAAAATPPATPADPATPSSEAAFQPNVVTMTADSNTSLFPLSPADTASGISTLREMGLDEKDAAYLASGKDLWVSPQVRERAETERKRCFADPEWVRAYLNGGMKERALMAAINVRMTAEVREG